MCLCVWEYATVVSMAVSMMMGLSVVVVVVDQPTGFDGWDDANTLLSDSQRRTKIRTMKENSVCIDYSWYCSGISFPQYDRVSLSE